MIADVLTPLLGLDTMIKNSLSLHVEHDQKHPLANPAGDTTQLEYMGRHLYLIASPSQHALSHCLTGRLSHVIGFLPADKELHEQMLASRSSSSTDLDEDPSQPQEHVVSATVVEHDELSLELSTGKGEFADSGGELRVQSFYPKLSRPTKQPSAQERELHSSDHPALQSWRVGSQEAKGRAFQQSARTSMIHLDYAYIQQPRDQKPTAILT